MVHLLALLTLLFGFAAALSVSLTDHARKYSVGGGRIVAWDRSTGRVIWQRAAPAPRFGWLGQAGDVLVGVGTAQEPVLVGNDPKDVFQVQPVDTVYGVSAGDGSLKWRYKPGIQLKKESRVIQGMVVVTVANPAYAMFNTDVLNAKTGHVILSTTGAVTYQDQTQVVFECAFASVPYCSGAHQAELYRVHLPSKKVERWELPRPEFKGCEYDDVAVNHRSRFTSKYVDYLIEDSCGWVFVRYAWAGGPRQKPLIRRIAAPEWPKGL